MLRDIIIRHIICLLAGGILVILPGCTKGFVPYTSEEVVKANPGLQAVLNHCAGDSLKLEAARFLIRNLPYHHSMVGEAWNDYLKLFELHGQHTLYPEEVLDSISRAYGPFQLHTLRPVSDVNINPGYLIENIDLAFEVWRGQPWGKNVAFATFLEYVLPYRVGDEPLESWREEIYNAYNPLLDSIRALPEAGDPAFVAKFLLDTLMREPVNFTNIFPKGPHYGPKVVKWRSGGCMHFTDIMLYVFRALGLPCSEEFMLNRGNGNAAHFWNGVFDKDGNVSYCSLLDGEAELKDPATMWDPKGKVYRRTFSVNAAMLDEIGLPLDEIYPGFRCPTMVDVTGLYAGDRSWRVAIPADSLYEHMRSGTPLYLCSARHLEWVPVGIGRMERGEAVFDDVEGQALFRIATYEDGGLRMQSDPFELGRDDGQVRFISPTGRDREVTILHKYELYFEPSVRKMTGGVFEGSDYPDFHEADTLHVIAEMPRRLYNVVDIGGCRPYRYVRFRGAPESSCDIAELSFRAADSGEVLSGRIIGTPGNKEGKGDKDLGNVFDGDPYTSFSYKEPSGGWVGLDFGRPVGIGQIIYTPRNRMNFINPGDEYELMYLDKEWRSAGKKKATLDSISFDVPEGSLLYLRYANGNDQRIFEYTDGRQRFW